MVGAMPRREGMERKDLLAANVKIFKVQGESLDKFAKKSVKVMVVGMISHKKSLITNFGHKHKIKNLIFFIKKF